VRNAAEVKYRGNGEVVVVVSGPYGRGVLLREREVVYSWAVNDGVDYRRENAGGRSNGRRVKVELRRAAYAFAGGLSKTIKVFRDSGRLF